MEKFYISLSIWFAFSAPVFSQMTYQIMGGVSPQSSPLSAGLIINRQSPHDEFVFNMSEVGPQYFGGIKTRLDLESSFFLDFGLTYTKSKSTYQLKYTLIDAEHPVTNHIMSETEHLLFLPVNLGVKIGDFELTSGIRAIHSIESRSDLHQLNGFENEENFITLGWQGGVGYNLFGTRIGIDFSSQFSRVGQGMSVNDQSLELMNVPGQFIFTIQRNL